VKFLLAPLVAWAIAQAAKVILTSVRQRRLNLRVLAETGGMPSSHAAIVMGMTTAVGKYAGSLPPRSRSPLSSRSWSCTTPRDCAAQPAGRPPS